MVIRKSTIADIPAIVALLKRSLGEQSSPKTIAYWNWKHVNNPFGASPVLVAEENGNLIGVRAMLQWQWQIGELNFSTLRAVDTATDPLHQGKGIFSLLTKQMLNDALESGKKFIFNTPNEKSKPGYIKMGWMEAGKLPVGLSLYFPNIFNHNKFALNESKILDVQQLKVLCSNWNESMALSGKIFTPKSPEYLHWRYTGNPIINYKVICTENIYLAFYIKNRKWGKELRISELIYTGKNNIVKKTIRKLLQQQVNVHKTYLVSFSPINTSLIKRMFKFVGFYGPIFTLKSVNVSNAEKEFIEKMDNWNYFLGDLELF
jgi:N-acetylglutamate synthase-like GNAT family acetyltransferase